LSVTAIGTYGLLTEIFTSASSPLTYSGFDESNETTGGSPTLELQEIMTPANKGNPASHAVRIKLDRLSMALSSLIVARR
jgi:hypothetical protein